MLFKVLLHSLIYKVGNKFENEWFWKKSKEILEWNNDENLKHNPTSLVKVKLFQYAAQWPPPADERRSEGDLQFITYPLMDIYSLYPSSLERYLYTTIYTFRDIFGELKTELFNMLGNKNKYLQKIVDKHF